MTDWRTEFRVSVEPETDRRGRACVVVSLSEYRVYPSGSNYFVRSCRSKEVTAPNFFLRLLGDNLAKRVNRVVAQFNMRARRMQQEADDVVRIADAFSA